MSAQYLRDCSLVVGSQSGQGLELSALHVKFSVHKSDTQAPAHADIRVYNLSDATAKQIQQEYTHVFLSAGYQGSVGLIFSGAVRQFRKGRENATDTYLDILAQDGDVGYNWAVANTTLAAGWTQQTLHDQLMESFTPLGLTAGYTPVFGAPPAPRAKVCYGMARDYMRTLADASGSSWHIADGQINMVPVAGVLPGAVIELTGATGMVGLPQQTINGITVRCLLNPQIRFGGQIKLNNASIQQQAFDVAYQPGGNHVFNQNVGGDVVKNTGLDDDGLYKVYSIETPGDTRGQPWYMDLICVAVNGTSPLTGPYINATASSTGF